MTDELRRQAAVGEADNAMALLRTKPPTDPATRRRQMAQIAKRFNKVSRILVEFDQPASDACQKGQHDGCRYIDCRCRCHLVAA